MVTRRQFLKLGAAGVLLLITHTGRGKAARATTRALASTPTLKPATIDKFVTRLVIPPAMPRTRSLSLRGSRSVDYYEIAVRQFRQQILPATMPATTVWGYGSANHPGSFNYPAFTIEARWNTPVRVKWINDLKDRTGSYLPHLLPVDQTLHWANPPTPTDDRSSNPAPYTGPVPIVTHVHGAHTGDESDGYAEAWFLPAARDIPPGYAETGSFYSRFRQEFRSERRIGHASDKWARGSATFQYPNDQRATTLWYHDHTLGVTRLNVYAGPAGFYILRGGPDDAVLTEGGAPAVLPGPAPTPDDPPDTKYYEIPLAIQDRSFNSDGSLFYPDSREFFDEFGGPYIPDSDIAPIWNPEFFANTIVVNGNTWPYLEVEPRRYRFRLLNGCNSRFLILKLSNGAPFWQIGAEGGFLPAPAQLDRLLIAPAERADVIVDFAGLPAGAKVTLLNLGPDEPFGGGEPGADFDPADPDSTGQVMQFVVVAASGADPSTPPEQLALPGPPALGPASLTRRLSLNEEDSAVLTDTGPRAALLGTVMMPEGEDGMPTGVPLMWMDPISEHVAPGVTELWEIYNFTMDAHPIHIHQTMFELVNREVFDEEHGVVGAISGPEPAEAGLKDTVIAYPGQITRVKLRFDLEGLYVWHCHIVEHEDNEMMRPFGVGTIPKPL